MQRLARRQEEANLAGEEASRRRQIIALNTEALDLATIQQRLRCSGDRAGALLGQRSSALLRRRTDFPLDSEAGSGCAVGGYVAQPCKSSRCVCGEGAGPLAVRPSAAAHTWYALLRSASSRTSASALALSDKNAWRTRYNRVRPAR